MSATIIKSRTARTKITPAGATKAKAEVPKAKGKMIVNELSSQVRVAFALSRETPGAVVYKEVNAEGEVLTGNDAVIGQLYIRKVALPGGTAPASVEVTIQF